jgi:hypothetical protein
MIHDGGARRECDAETIGRRVLVHWGIAGTYELAITTGRLKGTNAGTWRMRRPDWSKFRRDLGYVREEAEPWNFAKAAPKEAAEQMLEQLEQERDPFPIGRAELESDE